VSSAARAAGAGREVDAPPTTSGAAPWLRDGLLVGALALVARSCVALWAAGRFPPTADGSYYHRIAERIAAGLGYTWLWPDGAVTYAAHYPVGYPGAIGGIYAVLGVRPGAAMMLNAALGALAALAVHRLAARASSRRGAAIAGLLVALHPGLVFYTAALMTEGVTAALVTCAAWAAAAARGAARPAGSRARRLSFVVVLGLVLGAATMVRPQTLVLAPIFGMLAFGGDGALLRGRAARIAGALAGALLVTAIALLTCAPWTMRNCARMGRCALVSVNGGWNLLIGADAMSTGAWAPIQVPRACLEVFDEAAKDACFAKEARRFIAEQPATWLGLVPRKLAATFNYCGAPGWYLHEANSAAFGDHAKTALGAVETLYERLVVLLGLLWTTGYRRRSPADDAPRGRSSRAFRALQWTVALVGALSLFSLHAWVGYLALAIGACLRPRALARGPVLAAAAVAVLASCLLTHAVFFGAGRYAMVTFPLLSGIAGVFLGGRRSEAGLRI
jgi:4-amino-4-deoxy-L-arabinose transferase-like glycosyltransferase